MARQAHAAHHVDLPELLPQRVVDVEERAGTVDADVVDEDVGVRTRGDERGTAGGSADVGDHAIGIVAAGGLADCGHGGVDACLRAADHADRGAGRGQAGGDGEADAAGGTGDDGALAGKIDLHGGSPGTGCGADQPKRNAERVVFMTTCE